MVICFKFSKIISLSSITHLFLLYARISSTILKFLKGFQKLAIFPLLLTKFSIFLMSTCLLLAIFLKFIFNQKEKRGFIWSKTFDFLFQKPANIYSEKKSCSLKVAAFYFLGTPIKWSGFEWLLPFISIERLHKNVKILHSKLI